MKTLSDIFLELLLAAMILLFAATVSYPRLEEIIMPEPETDLASDCQRFPCYAAPHKLWVSKKYLTRKNK